MHKASVKLAQHMKRRRWLLGVSTLILLATGILFGIAYAYQVIGAKNDRVEHPPPGRLVDVGGHRLHAVVQGDGFPVVVFESGLARAGFDWAFVAPEVAKSTTVVTYDRAGLGFSEKGPTPRNGEEIAEELHSLLEELELPPPYLLVGHSCGGMYVRIFQHFHPDKVAGLIMVDAAHERGWDEMGVSEAVDMWHNTHFMYGLKAIQATLGYQRWRSVGGVQLKPQESNKSLPPEEQLYYQLSYRLPRFYSTYGAEHVGLEHTIGFMKSGLQPLEDLPLTVITGINDEALQDTLAALSTNTVYIPRGDPRTNGRGHFLHVSAPELIVEEIHKMVMAVRAE